MSYVEEQAKETLLLTFVGSLHGAVSEFGNNVRQNLHFLSITMGQAKQTITATVSDIFMFDFTDSEEVRKIEIR